MDLEKVMAILFFDDMVLGYFPLLLLIIHLKLNLYNAGFNEKPQRRYNCNNALFLHTIY